MPHRKSAVPSASILAVVFCFALAAPAAASSGGSLPWESPLQQIQQSLTGPVAGAIALAAMAIAGGVLIIGGDLPDFARRMIYLVMVAGLLLGGASVVALFGSTGASIGDDIAIEATASGRGEAADG